MNSSKNIYEVSASSKTIFAEIDLPASKSISNRALIINALSCSPHSVRNLSESDDTQILDKILNSNDSIFDVGHAGTAMRFLTAYLAGIEGKWEITGSARMQQRPIGILAEALRKLGARIEYAANTGFPPLRIRGSKLKGAVIELDGSISSQYISALLLIAPNVQHGITLRIKNKLTSRPYVDMTLKLMKLFGIQYAWDENRIVVPEQDYAPAPFSVEADWSSASYWYQILALCEQGEIFLKGLQFSGVQGDQAIAVWFSELGIESKAETGGIRIGKKKSKIPIAMNIDFSETPDMAQTMAALCTALKIPFSFSGLETLKIKETDRIKALQAELLKFGAKLAEPNAGELRWDGAIHRELTHEKPVIETYNDHRMALAFAPLALTGRTIAIENPNVVSKSYPGFWRDLVKAGFGVKEKF